jgi:hemerythrin-like domain-containing protein
MDAIETLMTEHRLIERVIQGLHAFAEGSARRPVDDKEELARFVTFIREFADAAHHGKEEDILFAAMVEAGFPREAGPVGVMLAEHHEGRRLVGVLRGLSEQAAPWSADDRQAMLEAANGYGGLLRQHIHKEDAILYPMAEARLDPDALDAVHSRCAAFDAGNAAAHERLVALGEELVARHAPGATSAPPPRMPFGGCPSMAR